MYEAVMAGSICPLLQALSKLVNLHFTQSTFTCQVQCINTMTRLRSLALGTCELSSLALNLTGLQHHHCCCKMNAMLCMSEGGLHMVTFRRHKCINQACLSA